MVRLMVRPRGGEVGEGVGRGDGLHVRLGGLDQSSRVWLWHGVVRCGTFWRLA